MVADKDKVNLRAVVVHLHNAAAADAAVVRALRLVGLAAPAVLLKRNRRVRGSLAVDEVFVLLVVVGERPSLGWHGTGVCCHHCSERVGKAGKTQ